MSLDIRNITTPDAGVRQRRGVIAELITRQGGGSATLNFHPPQQLAGMRAGKWEGWRDLDASGMEFLNIRLMKDELAPYGNLVRAGATFADFGASPTDTDVVTVDPTKAASWGTPNKADATTGVVCFTPHTLTTQIVISKQLLKVSPIAAVLVEAQIYSAIAFEMERATLLGSGGAGEPLGVLLTPPIPIIEGVPTAATLAAAERAVAEAYCEGAAGVAALTSPETREKFRAPAAASRGFWQPEIRQFVSPHITGDCAIVGNMADLIIATWGGIELLLNPFTSGIDGWTTMLASVYCDVSVRRPAAFTIIRES